MKCRLKVCKPRLSSSCMGEQKPIEHLSTPPPQLGKSRGQFKRAVNSLPSPHHTCSVCSNNTSIPPLHATHVSFSHLLLLPPPPTHLPPTAGEVRPDRPNYPHGKLTLCRDGLLQLGLPSRSSGRRETTKDVEKGVRSPCSCLWFAF